MRDLIKKILKEEVNKKTLKDIEDEILKNSYLVVSNEKWVIPKFDPLLQGIRKPKYEQHFKDNYKITNLQDMREITSNVNKRVIDMEEQHGFTFEHRLPYFEYPLSLYDLELAIKQAKSKKDSLGESHVQSNLNVGDKVTIVSNKKMGPMRWDYFKSPRIGVVFEKGRLIDDNATYLGQCYGDDFKILSHGHERCFDQDEIVITKNNY